MILFNLFKIWFYLKDKNDISTILYYYAWNLTFLYFALVYFQKSFAKLSTFPRFSAKKRHDQETPPTPTPYKRQINVSRGTNRYVRFP